MSLTSYVTFLFYTLCNVIKSVSTLVNCSTVHPVAQAKHFGVALRSVCLSPLLLSPSAHPVFSPPTHVLAPSLHWYATTRVHITVISCLGNCKYFPHGLPAFTSATFSPQPVALLQILHCLSIVFPFPFQPHWRSLYILPAGPLRLLFMLLGMI